MVLQYQTFLTKEAAFTFLENGSNKLSKTKMLEDEIRASGNGIWKTSQVFDTHHCEFESTDPSFVVAESSSNIQVYRGSYDATARQCTNIWKACESSSSFFIRKIVKPAFDASCGSEICSCIGHLTGDILEILEYCSNIKTSHTSDDVALVFVHLLFAAVNHSNALQAEKLVKILLKKGTNTLVKLNDVYAIDIAAERGAFELCRLLVHNGACLQPRALIHLINDMESHEFYRRKTKERMKQRMTVIQKSPNGTSLPSTPTALTPKQKIDSSSSKLTELEKNKDHHQIFLSEIFAQNRERMRVYLSKINSSENSFKNRAYRLGLEILFFGAAHSTLVHDTMSYLMVKLGRSLFMKLVNDADEYGVSPIHYASMNGHKDMISLLVSLGADPNVRTGKENGESRSKIFRSVIARHPKFRGYTPLALSVQNRRMFSYTNILH